MDHLLWDYDDRCRFLIVARTPEAAAKAARYFDLDLSRWNAITSDRAPAECAVLQRLDIIRTLPEVPS